MRNYDFYKNRRHVLLITIWLMLLLVIIKLFSIQIFSHKYKLSAQNNVIRSIVQYPERGWVYDRNNILLVANQRAYDIMTIPYQVEKNIDTLKLCEVFDLSISDFIKKTKLSKRYSRYKPSIFIKGLTKKNFANIQENLHLFQGFYAQPKYIREYATENGGGVFGYIGKANNKFLKNNPEYNQSDMMGVSGVEKMYESYLKGKKGVDRKIVDVFGRVQGKYKDGQYDTLSVAGDDITLTIDIELQKYAEEIMRGKRGSIVALEPSSGEILCLVSSPTYNPSFFLGKQRGTNFRKLFLDPGKPLYNRSISASYPPGSIFKLINALIALQEDNITPATQVRCNLGWNYKNILKIGCHKHSSPLNLRQSIAQSCNAYFCETFKKVVKSKKTSAEGLNHWRNHVMSFGLNQIFNNDFYSENAGFIPGAEYYNEIYGARRWAYSTCISLGIGQDAILMTPIQMANIAVIIANQGYYKTPHIIKKINQSMDTINKKFSKKNYCSIEKRHFKPVIYGMQTAVEGKYGTAKSAYLDGLKICGKTGTAQNPHGEDHSIFIGFAPKNNPKIAIAVYVENGGWGSDMAAPIGSLCLEKYIYRDVTRVKLNDIIKNRKIEY